MKNTTSLFLTLVSYIITLATILFLLFAAMPLSLKAQTDPAAGTGMTNAAVTNAVSQATADVSQGAQAPSVRADETGIHVSGPNPADTQPPLAATLAVLIPIVGIVMGCSIPIVTVGLLLYFRHRKNQMLHETVRAMVDKGVPVPPEMFTSSENSPKRTRNDLRTGLILTGLGIGVVAFIGKAGWIVFCLGLAFLAIAWFQTKNNDQPPKS
ncbi:MAG: DUF6249 domain-containing protein [Verrucomicrobiales bacterium]|nr:DUF6249 domain-containing protein [Verrucomicrobiales bacterium]